MVYNVGSSSRKPRREQGVPVGYHAPQWMPVQFFTDHSLLPVNTPPPSRPLLTNTPPPPSRPLLPNTPPAPYPLLPSTQVRMLSHFPTHASNPCSRYLPSYPANASAVATIRPGTLPMSLTGNQVCVPYSRSHSFPIPQCEGMVASQTGAVRQYPSVLPHSVGRSPPYRQISGRQDQQPHNPVALLQNPVVNITHPHTPSSGASQAYTVGHNAPVFIQNSPGLPSRHVSESPTIASSRQSEDSKRRRRRKRNKQKTKGDN